MVIGADKDQQHELLVLHQDLHRFFCQYFDVCEAPRLDEVPNYFTDDAVFNIYMSRAEEAAGTPTITARGGAGVKAMNEGALAQLEQTHHTLGSFWVEIENGQPVARAHLRAYHRGRRPGNSQDMESLSTFRAVMANEGGSWKIAHYDYVIFIVLGSLEAFPEVDELASR
jgi:hypothetical protein